MRVQSKLFKAALSETYCICNAIFLILRWGKFEKGQIIW